MLELLRKKKPTQVNKDVPASTQKELKRIRKRIGMQFGLACLTILLAVVILFGMTAAWYTNVVQTGSLIFEVEKLGVDVDAVISGTNFIAQPGDEGVISLTAKNKGQETVGITVSVNKSALTEEMQKRLYFFVEQQDVVNGEIAQRTYLTASDSFTYTVFAEETLCLTETYHNNSSLKWCWVYDVLGYYVLGQESEDTVTVQEYLRPIEYDYDSATFDAAGNLLTVDGTTSTAEFLAALSAADGYNGIISSDGKVGSYYKVDVNESGYGVYAYLCTYTEIEANTEYDTQLGQDALAGNPDSYSVRVTVQAEVLETTITSVSTAEQLTEAVTAGKEYIKLAGDVALDSSLTVSGDVTLDLNSHELTTSATGSAVAVAEGGSLTVLNGVVTAESATNVFQTIGADLTLAGVTVTGANAIRVEDYSGTGQDSVIRVSDSTMNLTGHGIMLFGNGTISEQDTQVILEDTTITAEGYVLAGNGTEARWGTDVQIIGCTLTSNGEDLSAIYHPQDGLLNIYKSTLCGANGITIKGGTVTIAESFVYGTDTTPEDPNPVVSGAASPGAAVYVEANYGWDISVTICSTHLESYHSLAYRVYPEDAANVTQSVTEAANGNTIKNESQKETTE